jgi:DNA-binding transcriptional MerR regulator
VIMTTAVFPVYSASGAFGLPMSAETSTKSKQATWLDPPWAAPDAKNAVDLSQWLTRQELLERMPNVDEVTLVYWEKRGILPRPIRRRRDGAPRALYPEIAVLAIATIRQAQEDGLSLDAAADLVRAFATDWVEMESLSDDIRRSKLGLLRLAHYQEQFQHLPSGTIRGAIVSFIDAKGEEVTRVEERLWSD